MTTMAFQITSFTVVLLNRLFRRRSKKTSKLHGTGLCVGNSSGPVNSPHKEPVTRKMFPFDDVIMGPLDFGYVKLLSPPETSAKYDDVIKWKHFPRYWPFVRGIHRSPVNSPHKGQWRGVLMFSLICAWINAWVNNREAGDLRRHHAHYDVTVMIRLKVLVSVQVSSAVRNSWIIINTTWQWLLWQFNLSSVGVCWYKETEPVCKDFGKTMPV